MPHVPWLGGGSCSHKSYVPSLRALLTNGAIVPVVCVCACLSFYATTRLPRCMVVLLVDLLDASGSFLPRVRDLVGRNPIILIGTKADLLPADAKVWCVQVHTQRRYIHFVMATVVMHSWRLIVGMLGTCVI